MFQFLRVESAGAPMGVHWCVSATNLHTLKTAIGVFDNADAWLRARGMSVSRFIMTKQRPSRRGQCTQCTQWLRGSNMLVEPVPGEGSEIGRLDESFMCVLQIPPPQEHV